MTQTDSKRTIKELLDECNEAALAERESIHQTIAAQQERAKRLEEQRTQEAVVGVLATLKTRVLARLHKLGATEEREIRIAFERVPSTIVDRVINNLVAKGEVERHTVDGKTFIVEQKLSTGFLKLCARRHTRTVEDTIIFTAPQVRRDRYSDEETTLMLAGDAPLPDPEEEHTSQDQTYGLTYEQALVADYNDALIEATFERKFPLDPKKHSRDSDELLNASREDQNEVGPQAKPNLEGKLAYREALLERILKQVDRRAEARKDKQGFVSMWYGTYALRTLQKTFLAGSNYAAATNRLEREIAELREQILDSAIAGEQQVLLIQQQLTNQGERNAARAARTYKAREGRKNFRRNWLGYMTPEQQKEAKMKQEAKREAAFAQDFEDAHCEDNQRWQDEQDNEAEFARHLEEEAERQAQYEADKDLTMSDLVAASFDRMREEARAEDNQWETDYADDGEEALI